MATATLPAYTRNRDGFPIEQCGRCGGTGFRPEYAGIYGGQCFGCTNGWIFPAGTPAKLGIKWTETNEAARRAVLGIAISIDADGTWAYSQDVHPGDTIRNGKDDAWRTVATVRDRRRILGECYIGNRLASLTIEAEYVFTDGTTYKAGSQIWTRKIDVVALTAIRDDLAARARAAYERTMLRRETAAVKAAAKREAEAARIAALPPVYADLLAAHPEFVIFTGEFLTIADTYGHGFMTDMHQAFNRGRMTDRQVEATLRTIARYAKADQVDEDAVPVPSGRMTFTGEIASVKIDDGYGGRLRYRMVVRSEAGWKVFGTIPQSLLDSVDYDADVLRGRMVTMTATVEPSEKDPGFGFFSRPTVAA